MARNQVLTEAQELQIPALLHAGLTQAQAAAALGCSRSTVQRAVRRRRDRPQTLDELLQAIPDLGEVLASPPLPQRPVRRRRGDGWEKAAAELARTAPDRWG